MNADSERLQQAIHKRRRARGPLRCWVLLRCPRENCPCREINVWIDEGPGCKVFQAPCRCVRDGLELEFEGFEDT
jgi:hypothetical protein